MTNDEIPNDEKPRKAKWPPALRQSSLGIRGSFVIGCFVIRHFDFDPRYVVAAEAQAGVSEADLDRVAERGVPEHFNLLALQHAQVQQPLHQGRVALERQDAAP